MAKYAYIENNPRSGGVIIKEYYDFLPQNWKNISGLNNIKDEEYLKNIGWYKIIKNEINYDDSCERIISYNYIFENNNVYEIPVLERFEPVIQALSIPQQISATQVRLWLVKNNIPLSSIDHAISSIEDELTRSELLIIWEYAPYIERSNPFIDNLGSLLGLSKDQIDQAFIESANFLT
jgi:hypothetical protein